MEPTTIIIIVVIAAVVVVGVLASRKKKTPELEDREPERLPSDEKAAEPKKPARPAREEKKKPEPKAETRGAEPEEEKPPAEPEEEDEELEEEFEEAAAPAPPPAPLATRKRDVKGLRKGLKKVREEGGLFGRLKALFGGKKEIDPNIVEEMEEILLTSDVGVKTTEALLEDIREQLKKDELADPEAVWNALRDRTRELLDVGGDGPIRNHGKPTVALMVGVNGTGKTTTIGKLATQFLKQDKKVLLVAGDTFRAAAVSQLKAWGQRVGCEVFAGKEDADPASVVYDAVEHAIEGRFDLVLVDTAGRLHTKTNLMDELSKVVRTCGKALDGAPHETLLVLDGTTGQNALQQAEQFGDALELSGIVLTKLDGTAKGGIILSIAQEHGLPVRYVGVGERPKDLRDFDADEFVEAMLGGADEAVRAA